MGVIGTALGLVGGLFNIGASLIPDKEIGHSEKNYVVTGNYTNAGLYQNSVAKLDSETSDWTETKVPKSKKILSGIGTWLQGTSSAAGYTEDRIKKNKDSKNSEKDK